jgi:hypothetical protein
MSPVDPRKTVDTPATDPNKGLNTRTFLIAVGVALFVILLVLFAFVHRSSKAIKPVQDGRPTSRLSTSPAPLTRG